jgi:hypothetical protein
MKYVIVFIIGVATGVAGLFGAIWLSEELDRRKW